MHPRTQFPGIHLHAASLRCSANHLRLVIQGVRKNEELLARYRALVAVDPTGKAGAGAVFLPTGTAFAECTPDQIAEARKSFGEQVEIQGQDIILRAPFILIRSGTTETKLQPAAGPNTL